MSTSLSKWSMSYFAAGLAWLLAAELLMVAGFGFPGAGIRFPDTLVVVHMIGIGWLSMTMCGALFQFVPVLIAKPLYSERGTLLSFVLLTAGLIVLLGGFLELGGRIEKTIALLPVGAVLLGAGFAFVVTNLGLTLWRADRLDGPARFVVFGLVCICCTALFGGVFAFALGGIADHPWLWRLLASGTPIHAIAGLGGWLTLTSMGVSYRLLAMFLLSADIEERRSRQALLAGCACVGVAIGAGSIVILAGGEIESVLALSGVLGLAALALYGRDVSGLYRNRKRRTLELNMRAAGWSFISLGASAILGLALVLTDQLGAHAGALGFLAAFGWLSGLTLAMLYKIVAFLTWLEAYGPLVGRAITPRVQDLVAERRARKWFVIFFIAVWGATVALLAGSPAAFRSFMLVAAVATTGIVAQLVMIRRLHGVTQAARLPAGTSIPHLLFSRS